LLGIVISTAGGNGESCLVQPAILKKELRHKQNMLALKFSLLKFFIF